MTDTMDTKLSTLPNRTAKIDARISEEMRGELIRIAVFRDADLSDIIREALRFYVAQVKARAA